MEQRQAVTNEEGARLSQREPSREADSRPIDPADHDDASARGRGERLTDAHSYAGIPA